MTHSEPSTFDCVPRAAFIDAMRAVAANRVFCVNVLPQSRQDIADRFAGCHDDLVTDRFEGVECGSGNGTGPAIAGATEFSCALRETVDLGSHRIFIGHVVEVRQGSPAPLTYLNGAYHRVVPQPSAAE